VDDPSNWTDDSYLTERRGRGRGPMLVLVLVLVVAIGALAYVGIELGAKVINFANGFIVHTVREKSSPDGSWKLVVDTSDEGAVGGFTSVYLMQRADGHRYALYEDDWLPDSAVRWRDARTVVINGVLRMPFIEKSISTGSSSTSGSPGADGYVHNTIRPGERVVLLSGLSVVLPDTPGELATLPKPPIQPVQWQWLTPSSNGPRSYSVVTYREQGPSVPWKRISHGRLLAQGAGGRIQVRWRPGREVLVITSLPGHGIGVITAQTALESAQAARGEARRVWNQLAVWGARLPV
jgi:hypothetical protein